MVVMLLSGLFFALPSIHCSIAVDLESAASISIFTVTHFVDPEGGNGYAFSQKIIMHVDFFIL